MTSINNSSQIYLIFLKGRGFAGLAGLAGEQLKCGCVEKRCGVRSVSSMGHSSLGCHCLRGCQHMDFTLYRLIHGHARKLIQQYVCTCVCAVSHQGKVGGLASSPCRKSHSTLTHFPSLTNGMVAMACGLCC